MMKGRVLICIPFLFLCFISTAPLFSQNSTGFPHETEWHYRVYEDEGSYASRITIKKDSDGGWNFRTLCPYYALDIHTDERVEIQESRGDYFEDRFIQISKARSFHIRRLSSGPYQCLRINKKGYEKSTIQELQGALDMSTVKFKLLYLFHQAGTSFDLEMDLFDPGRQRPFRMVFTSSKLSGPEIRAAFPDYSYPAPFENLLNNDETMILVDGRLGGLPGTIYPHPFIYLMDQDFNLLAEWGGKTEFPYYTWYE